MNITGIAGVMPISSIRISIFTFIIARTGARIAEQKQRRLAKINVPISASPGIRNANE
jgi:hypothetical protein